MQLNTRLFKRDILLFNKARDYIVFINNTLNFTSVNNNIKRLITIIN